MKILYNSDCDLCFSHYGIEIPILDDRAKKVFDKLNQTFGHFNIIENYDIPKINRDDLTLVHNKDYVDALYSSYSNLEACKLAKGYLYEAMLATKNHKIGKGHGPVHHFHKWWQL